MPLPVPATHHKALKTAADPSGVLLPLDIPVAGHSNVNTVEVGLRRLRLGPEGLGETSKLSARKVFLKLSYLQAAVGFR